jgi:parallel beta-helix repeat protein
MECAGPPQPGETTSDVSALEGAARVEEDTTLTADVRCARGPAFVVTADDVVLDLGGHAVSGEGDAGAAGPAIVLQGVRGATVRNGTVQRFDAGVVIDGGSANVVEDLVIEDNIGSPDGEFGDGIVINGSSDNTVRANVVRRNGPFSGISLGRGAQGNQLVGNTVADNNMLHVGDPNAGAQAMGIRVEGPAANGNRIVGNTVTGSGGDGIVVLSTCDDFDTEPPCAGTPPNEQNEIAENTVSGNGTSGRGSGIRIFAMPVPIAPVENTVRDNVADDNAFYGIAIDAGPLGSKGNTALRNRAHGNREFDGSDGRLMPPCGPNTWEGNEFGTVNQPCVSGRPEAPSPAD